MHFFSTPLRDLRALPYRMRLGVLGLCYLLCTLVFTVSFFYTHDASLFGLPVALVAWLFKRRETSIFLCIIIFTVALFNTFYMASYIWPRSLIISFLIGSLIFIVVAFFISYLRGMLDTTEEARRLAQEAERQIAEANKIQQRLNRSKDQLLLNISHEMRTPLTEIHGYLDLLQSYDTQLDATMRETFVTNAISGCEELEGLVNNVLDAMHAGNITPRLDNVIVAQVVQEVLQQFDPRKLQAFSLYTDIPGHLQARADSQYVRRILRNLLSNAFKYAQPHTPVALTAGLHQASNGGTYICVRVQDAGPGIPLEEKSQLFEKFARLERDLYGKTRGTGLGLYISKQLVEVMGGTIWVESSGIVGEGSTFCFTLPYMSSKPRALLDGNAIQYVQRPSTIQRGKVE